MILELLREICMRAHRRNIPAPVFNGASTKIMVATEWLLCMIGRAVQYWWGELKVCRNITGIFKIHMNVLLDGQLLAQLKVVFLLLHSY